LTPFPTNKYLLENLATKTALDEVRNLVMPKGVIVSWGRPITDIPVGFVLCDGRTVEGYGTVPDLRRRFIVGFDPNASNMPEDTNEPSLSDAARLTENYGKIGNKGGKANVTIGTSQLPDFTLSIPGQWGRDDQNFTNTNAFEAGDRLPNDPNLAFNLNQKYSRNKTAGEYGQPHENRPPYYVLAYIIKVI
jgi:hypothetical protein